MKPKRGPPQRNREKVPGKVESDDAKRDTGTEQPEAPIEIPVVVDWYTAVVFGCPVRYVIPGQKRKVKIKSLSIEIPRMEVKVHSQKFLEPVRRRTKKTAVAWQIAIEI